MKSILKFVFFTFIFTSCARVQTLNMKQHYYSDSPTHIIWIQLAGFSDDHLPLLRFNSPLSANHTWVENVTCTGKMWNYNLYDLRPNATSSFASELLGSKNITNSCKDLSKKFIWENLKEKGFNISILENGLTENESLTKYANCDGLNNNAFNGARFWKMSKASSDGKFFHSQEDSEKIKEAQLPGVYFDRSCQNGTCFSSMLNNLKALYSSYLSDSSSSFLLIRDFNYLSAIKRKDVGSMKEQLNEIEQLIKWVSGSDFKNVLVLITSSEAYHFDFPLEGRQWEEFERTGKNFNIKSPGPAAENFCGIFDESEISERLLFEFPRKQFFWDILNPF